MTRQNQMGELVKYLSITTQLFATRMGKMLEPHGLTQSQLGILFHIARPDLRDGQRISDIARAVEVGQPAVTKVITKFENLGLVELVDDVQDRRVRKVRATAAAGRLIGDIQSALGPGFGRVFAGLSDGDLEQGIEVLTRLAAAMDSNRL